MQESVVELISVNRPRLGSGRVVSKLLFEVTNDNHLFRL